MLGDLGVKLGRAGSDDLRDAERSVWVGRVSLLKLPHPLDPLGIGVNDRGPPEDSGVVNDVDGAPVGQMWDHQLGETLDRDPFVRRGREELGRIGQDLEAYETFRTLTGLIPGGRRLLSACFAWLVPHVE